MEGSLIYGQSNPSPIHTSYSPLYYNFNLCVYYKFYREGILTALAPTFNKWSLILPKKMISKSFTLSL